MLSAMKWCVVCGRRFQANRGEASAVGMCSTACMTAHYLRQLALRR